MSGFPVATHSGEVEILGVVVRVYQLDDGRRIIDEKSMTDLLAVLFDDSPLSVDDAAKIADVVRGKVTWKPLEGEKA